uniref:ATP synthase epsilon chain, chloroplastic n=16 Tax=Pinus subgen. Strobus TaxID=139272 RepID=G8IVN2_PINPU|nr:ATP synthase CF1 epsilon subunit [Pinus strobus]YP_009179896.1 ATP synthase, F0 complex, c subunit [Pinus bungeana]YP_009243483.1 H+-ATPase epsilon subunit [Pinus armandii]YP_009524124.1 H+-ATPase epsilon subunit [Pinus wangii]YP_009524197.1 H+-ATPase epsilon subunit [Pinus squamata]YP_009524270.1 H+-ATPase epsilon subunit [Pinus parviflora]YP_009524343.1 H+-ATPase epsilon subunit [Pinus morrisonicola]YP_009561756.1 H+-ATPase epsilon subunit [Pinus pumila]AET44536.1 ATP synthase, F0 comp
MTLNLRVLSPNRVIWDSEVQEIIISTNSGQMGVLPNHVSLVTAVDIGVMKIRLNGKWSTMALMGGFAKIDKDRITILVNNAERDVDIDLQKAQETFRRAKACLAQAEGKRQVIEADVALKRARTLLEAINASPSDSN